MKRYSPLIVGAAVLLLSGVLHGLWSDRWTVSAAVETSCQRLTAVPESVADWESQPLELDPRQMTVSEASGQFARRFVQRGAGREVSMILLCGRRGPLSVHQPDVCYTASGYHLAAAPSKWTPPGVEGVSFWTARFTRPGQEAAPLRVFWAWSSDGAWLAADQPRIEFGSRPALYKLYLVERMTRPDEALEEGGAAEFLRQMLPQLRKSLGPSAVTVANSSR
jgi:hypothetical protein